MYVPKHFEQSSIKAMHALMRAYPLATLVTSTPDGPQVNHVPFYLAADPQPHGLLSGHVPRANAVWRDADPDFDAIAVFHGPNAYISPGWYASKQETGRVVPTWNYTLVHARGRIRIIDDPAWLASHLQQLTNRHEAGRPEPWAVSDAPEDYVARQYRALVGIEIPITGLTGKWKLSQNRNERDREGVIAGLEGLADRQGAQMARLVEQGTSYNDSGEP